MTRSRAPRATVNIYASDADAASVQRHNGLAIIRIGDLAFTFDASGGAALKEQISRALQMLSAANVA